MMPQIKESETMSDSSWSDHGLEGRASCACRATLDRFAGI